MCPYLTERANRERCWGIFRLYIGMPILPYMVGHFSNTTQGSALRYPQYFFIFISPSFLPPPLQFFPSFKYQHKFSLLKNVLSDSDHIDLLFLIYCTKTLSYTIQNLIIHHFGLFPNCLICVCLFSPNQSAAAVE